MMARKADQRIVWLDEVYSLGIPLIDKQHRHLIELAGRAQALKDYDASFAEMDEIFRQLVDYTRYHFLIEDTLMGKFGYSQSVDHRAKHANFTENLIHLYDTYTRLEGHRDNVLVFLTHKLSDWLTHHILKDDRKMADYLRPYLSQVSEQEMLRMISCGDVGPG